MHLEVVVTGASEAASAQRAGASRLELVSELERGGITPADRIIDEVVQAVTIPVHVIVRPHSDGFVYDAASRRAILESAARLRDLGASCIVFGALDEHKRVESAFVREVGAAAQLPMTFHRAFDDTHNLSAAYATLSGIPRVERVLTSGGAARAWDGRKWLRELCYGNTFPTVIACGDIDADNMMDVVRYAGVREVHVGRGARTDGKLDPKKIERLASLLYEGSAR
jgi:copper homeostasis protein